MSTRRCRRTAPWCCRRYFVELQIRTDRPDDETDRAVSLFASRIEGTQLERVDGREMSAEIRSTRVRDFEEMRQFFHEEEEDDRDENATTQKFPDQAEVNAFPLSPQVIEIATRIFEENVAIDNDLEDASQVALDAINAAKVFVLMLARMTPQE